MYGTLILFGCFQLPGGVLINNHNKYTKNGNMESILKIVEVPLTSNSMNAFGFSMDRTSNPLVAGSDDEGVLSLISREQASRAFEYYALDPIERTPALYNQGCAHVSKAVNELYESLVLDTSWSETSRELFEAVNCGNIVDSANIEGKPRRSDLCRRNQSVAVRADHMTVLTVRANAKLYWDREKELHAYASVRAVKYTAADPGPYLEYERRFSEAGEDEVMGSVDVVVRKLVDGDAVRESVRVVQKFVVEANFQYQMIQALYELCVWQFVMQANEVAAWQVVEDKVSFVEQWALRINKKMELVRMLSKISLKDYSVSSRCNMEPGNEKPKRVKAPTKFDRFYIEKKLEGVKLTKKELKMKFDELSNEEKCAYTKPIAISKKRDSAVMNDTGAASDDEDPYAFQPDEKKLKSVGTPFDDDDGGDVSNEDEEDHDFDVENPDDDDDDDDDDEDVDDDDVDDDDVDDDDTDSLADEQTLSKKAESVGEKPEPECKKPAGKKPVDEKSEGKKPVGEKSEGKKPVGEKSGTKKNKPIDAKAKISCKGVLPLTKTKVVDPPKADAAPDRDIVHELVRSSKEHFLWELFSHNMHAMITARKPFTGFENTVFESAHAEWLKQSGEESDEVRFRMAKKELSKIPGIVNCFHMFNLLFKPDTVSDEEEGEEDFLMG